MLQRYNSPLIRAVRFRKTLMQHNSVVVLNNNGYPLKHKAALTIVT